MNRLVLGMFWGVKGRDRKIKADAQVWTGVSGCWVEELKQEQVWGRWSLAALGHRDSRIEI